MTPLQERFKEAIDDNDCLVDYIANDHCILPGQYNELSIACEKIADEFAKEFTQWMAGNYSYYYSKSKDGECLWIKTGGRGVPKPTSQLLQHFKEERK